MVIRQWDPISLLYLGLGVTRSRDEGSHTDRVPDLGSPQRRQGEVEALERRERPDQPTRSMVPTRNRAARSS